MALGGYEADTILVNLQVARGLFTDNVRSNNQPFQDLLLDLDHLEVLD